MADPGDGPGGPVPPLCLDENEARRVETTFFLGRPPPSPPSEGLDRPLFSGLFYEYKILCFSRLLYMKLDSHSDLLVFR